MAAHGGDDLPFVLKDRAPSSKGIVVFTHKERSVIEAGGEALAPILDELREHYLVALHWGHYAAGVEEIAWVDVHLAAPGTISFAPRAPPPPAPPPRPRHPP